MMSENSSINYPNTFHNDKWQVSFTNLPSLVSIKDMRIYDNFVKSVTFPDYSMGEIISDMPGGYKIRHPLGPSPNASLSQVQIDFKLSEDMRNYINLFEWMRALRYGDVSGFSDIEDIFRKNTIKGILLGILDNQKRVIASWRFSNAFLLTLSSVSLVNGSSDEVTFTCNFSYEEVFYKSETIF